MASRPSISTKFSSFDSNMTIMKKRLTEFPYKSIAMTSYGLTEKQENTVREFLRNNCKNFQKLKFTFLPFGVFFPAILRSATTLTHLIIARENELTFERGPLIDFPNLKWLVLANATAFMRIIKSHCLERFEIFGYNGEDYYEPFLRTCNKLTNFSVNKEFPKIDGDLIPFKLKRFTVSQMQPASIDNIKNFLRGHRETLRDIEYVLQQTCVLDMTHFVLDELSVKYIFCEGHYNYNPPSYSGKEFNSAVENFAFEMRPFNFETMRRSPVGSSKAFIDILRRLSDLKKLRFSAEAFDLDEILIKSNLNVLKSLQVDYQTDIRNIATADKLDSVEELIVGRVTKEEEKNAAYRLMSYCPNITHLVFDMWTYRTSNDRTLTRYDLKNIVNPLKSLKTLSFNAWYPPSFCFYETLKNIDNRPQFVNIEILDDYYVILGNEMLKGGRFVYTVTNPEKNSKAVDFTKVSMLHNGERYVAYEEVSDDPQENLVEKAAYDKIQFPEKFRKCPNIDF